VPGASEREFRVLLRAGALSKSSGGRERLAECDVDREILSSHAVALRRRSDSDEQCRRGFDHAHAIGLSQ
jgi:hypothetical protein